MARLALILALLAMGCPPNSGVVEREGEPDVVFVDGTNELMNRAMRDAQKSVQGFIAQLPSLRERGAYFSVKVPIGEPPDIEHIWLSDPEYRDGAFHGRLGNEPLSEGYSFGDRVSARSSEISDWMAVVDGKLYGGFTVLVARSQLNRQQQEEFDQSVGFLVPDSPRRF